MPAMPLSKEQAALCVGFSMWLRLKNKGTKFNYKSSDWESDLKDVMSSLNILDRAFYVKLVKMFDKWCVGRRIKLIEITKRSKEEDGSVSARKDKELVVSPFGAMGLFDAHIISHIEALVKNIDGFGKIKTFYASYE